MKTFFYGQIMLPSKNLNVKSLCNLTKNNSKIFLFSPVFSRKYHFLKENQNFKKSNYYK